MTFEYSKPMELFKEKPLVMICAPMVRYSRLAFRRLVRLYDCDLCFTPMIVSDSFNKSNKARDSDFTYCDADRPLITQFAASNASDFATAAQLVQNYCDGVDLNCGCPQTWAMKEGYGACLMRNPELVADMVKQTRNAVSVPEFTISIKIRIYHDVRRTVDLAQQLEAAGVDFVTVHGRTVDQRCDPVNLETIKNIVDALHIPVIANGDIKSREDCGRVHEATGAKGVMSARGILANPALYSGAETTPLSCVKNWVRISAETGQHFSAFHNHLIYMMDKMMCKAERRYFHALGSFPGVVDYLSEKYFIDFSKT